MTYTVHDMLTDLANVPNDERRGFLNAFGIWTLRAAADLCGVDSETMSKREAILAILNNFS